MKVWCLPIFQQCFEKCQGWLKLKTYIQKLILKLSKGKVKSYLTQGKNWLKVWEHWYVFLNLVSFTVQTLYSKFIFLTNCNTETLESLDKPEKTWSRVLRSKAHWVNTDLKSVQQSADVKKKQFWKVSNVSTFKKVIKNLSNSCRQIPKKKYLRGSLKSFCQSPLFVFHQFWIKFNASKV